MPGNMYPFAIILKTTVVILCTMLQTAVQGQRQSDSQDYCVESGFTAECPIGMVVLMQEAAYGRMELGTCLTLDIGFMNCESDVLFYMDQWCSGKHRCQVDVEGFVRLTNSCPREVVGYLRAKYTCLAVLDEEECCLPQGNVINVTDSTGYMVPLVGKCPAIGCPLLLRAKKGRQLNIWFYYFNSTSTDQDNAPCLGHVTINEEGITISMALCRSDVRRKHVYTSSTNEVELLVVNEEDVQGTNRLIFEFEAFGCSEPIPPDHSYFEREGSIATLRCFNLSDTSWNITCIEGQWFGEIGTCELGNSYNEDSEDNSYGSFQITADIAITLIISFAVIISLAIMIIGVICIKRDRGNTQGQRGHQQLSMETSYNYTANSLKGNIFSEHAFSMANQQDDGDQCGMTESDTTNNTINIPIAYCHGTNIPLNGIRETEQM